MDSNKDLNKKSVRRSKTPERATPDTSLQMTATEDTADIVSTFMHYYNGWRFAMSNIFILTISR